MQRQAKKAVPLKAVHVEQSQVLCAVALFEISALVFPPSNQPSQDSSTMALQQVRSAHSGVPLSLMQQCGKSTLQEAFCCFCMSQGMMSTWHYRLLVALRMTSPGHKSKFSYEDHWETLDLPHRTIVRHECYPKQLGGREG